MSFNPLSKSHARICVDDNWQIPIQTRISRRRYCLLFVTPRLAAVFQPSDPRDQNDPSLTLSQLGNVAMGLMPIPTKRVFVACLRGDTDYKEFESALSQPGTGPFPWRVPLQRTFFELQPAVQSVKVPRPKSSSLEDGHSFPTYFVARMDIPRSRVFFNIQPYANGCGQASLRTSVEERDTIALGNSNCYVVEFSLDHMIRNLAVQAPAVNVVGPAAGDLAPPGPWPVWRSVDDWRTDIVASQRIQKRQRLEQAEQNALSLVTDRRQSVIQAEQELADVRAELSRP